MADDGTLTASILIFASGALAIMLFGTRITRVVDQLADRTGVGEAVAGALFLGAATSLSGSVLSVTAAWNGHPTLAVSNAIGGIAVQTLFLAVADCFYRRANLEHAAASAPNMLQNALLIVLLALILLGPITPDLTFFSIHPITPVLFIFYIYGIKLVQSAFERPMWLPSRTRETRADEPDTHNRHVSLGRLWGEFVVLMLVLGLAGWWLEPAAANIAAKSGIGETVVGVLLTAISTSIPELVTSVAAVRRGALTLAVGGIIGGNAFDTLFTAASDIAYRPGSIYHHIPQETIVWLVLTLLMSGVLLMGQIRRQEQGPGGIGFESVGVIGIYVLGLVLMLG
ncbi:sodium:calcium antiporter [Marinobacterium mangrovicola]|uniref:Cation:H+ antiporter n=1 Tax=Marinobacterium mangrovicola TaxID=1476959 RepID=A0A4R1GPT9_9GAMM|nr:sodium:calcium antiporter [Marinobacterium mangrovicola]TCK09360.1 cation:H+ antiporter [Marinobacterium mangrovicola]